MSLWVLSYKKCFLLGEWTGGGVDENCRSHQQLSSQQKGVFQAQLTFLRSTLTNVCWKRGSGQGRWTSSPVYITSSIEQFKSHQAPLSLFRRQVEVGTPGRWLPEGRWWARERWDRAGRCPRAVQERTALMFLMQQAFYKADLCTQY